MSEITVWEINDPKCWTKDDLVELATQGKDVWNREIARWYQYNKPRENFSDLIDFTGVTFDHDFDGYSFPCRVDFENSTLREPSFNKAEFSAEARFLETKFENNVTFNLVGSKKSYSFDFQKNDFGGHVFLFSLANKSERVESVYLSFRNVDMPPKKQVIEIDCSSALIQLYFYDCTLEKNELIQRINCNCLVYRFYENVINASTVFFDNIAVREKKCYISLENNKFKDAWLGFHELSLPGEINFSNHERMGVETLFYLCEIGTLSFSKCSFEYSFWQIVDCQINRNIKMADMDFKSIARLRFPEKAYGVELAWEYSDANNRNIAKYFDHGYTSCGFAFRGTKVSGSLSSIDNCDFIGAVSFVGSVFDCPVSLQNTTFKDDVPDWRLTKFNAHFSIDGIEVDLADKHDTAIDRKTYRDLSDRYRRLKELAITAKDHDRELDFFAEEMRTKRLGEEKWYLRLPNCLYGAFSAYGRSIARPFVFLIALLAITTLSVFNLSNANPILGFCEKLVLSFKLSLLNLLPFLGSGRSLFANTYSQLFEDIVGFRGVDFLLIVEGGFGFVFIFLIGLALRNRFRL